MQDDQVNPTGPSAADELSTLSWAEYLDHPAPDRGRPRPPLLPQIRPYTLVMLTLLAVLVVVGLIAGVSGGNGAGIIVAVVLLAFVFLPVALVIILERRRPQEP